MPFDKTACRHAYILFFILLIGTGFRLAVMSQTRYLAASGYSSYMKSTLNLISGNKEILAGEGEWRDSRALFNKLFTIDEAGIDYRQLFRELSRSNHPPLYYYLMHTIISFTSEKTATFNIGFFINLAAFWINVFLVYFLGSILFTSRIVPLFAAFLSAAGFLSMEVFVIHKGYELQSTFILLIFFLVFKYFEQDSLRMGHYLLFGFACLSAFLTHYFSYFFVTGIGLIIFFQYTWFRRDFRRLCFLGITTVVSAITAFIVYPPSIRDVLMDYRSVEIQEKLVTADSIFLYKIKIAVQMFLRNCLATPYLLLIACIVTLIILVALVKPRGLNLKKLVLDKKYLILVAYFFACYFLIIFISPFNSFRYVAPLLPLFAIILAGLLQVLPDGIQLRTALFLSVLFITFNIYGLAKVSQGELPGSALISSWRTERTLADLAEDSSVIIVTSKPNEKIRPILYHAPPRAIAFCINDIPEELFCGDSEIMVFVDTRIPDIVRSRNIENLNQHGFRRSGLFKGFTVLKREAGIGTSAQAVRAPVW